MDVTVENVPHRMRGSVEVRTICNKKFTIEVNGSDTVLQVKQKIAGIEEVPVDLQKLVVAGKILENERTLNDYNISSGAHIYLLRNLLGN